jgi:hypothetical protein
LGFGVFAKIFSKNIVIPSKEIPFFGKAHQRFWAIITKFGFFGVLQMAQIAKFGYLGDPNNRITEYLVIRVKIWRFDFFRFCSDHPENWQASLETKFS